MTQIIIEYDARNKMAKKTIEYILSLGIFKVKKKLSGIEEGIKEMESGDTIKCKDYEDYLKKTK